MAAQMLCAHSTSTLTTLRFHTSVPKAGFSLRRSAFPLRVVAAAADQISTQVLTLNLKVEGTIADSLIPKVTDALKKFEGVSNLKVYTSEGVATVEVAKETSIQATGEASSLLEAIQAEGFKMQNLSICFDDPAADGDEDIAYEYETAS